jgi:hypothetical protein
MEDIQTDVEFRIVPSGDGGWYWEVIRWKNPLNYSVRAAYY